MANFRPLAARAIIEKFSSTGAHVLDFCAGYGGRLLGTLALERHYIGIDASQHQVHGLRRMVEALRSLAPGTAELYHDRAEHVLKSVPSKSVDLVFSSPPFYNKELYNADLMQSAQRYSSYQSWLEKFLGPIIQQSHRIVRPGGFFVINVADQRDFRLQADTIRFAGPLFGRPRVLRMLMHSRPVQRSKATETFRWEPILVFKRSGTCTRAHR